MPSPKPFNTTNRHRLSSDWVERCLHGARRSSAARTFRLSSVALFAVVLTISGSPRPSLPGTAGTLSAFSAPGVGDTEPLDQIAASSKTIGLSIFGGVYISNASSLAGLTPNPFVILGISGSGVAGPGYPFATASLEYYFDLIAPQGGSPSTVVPVEQHYSIEESSLYTGAVFQMEGYESVSSRSTGALEAYSNLCPSSTMMLVGFGVLGVAIKRHRRESRRLLPSVSAGSNHDARPFTRAIFHGRFGLPAKFGLPPKFGVPTAGAWRSLRTRTCSISSLTVFAAALAISGSATAGSLPGAAGFLTAFSSAGDSVTKDPNDLGLALSQAVDCLPSAGCIPLSSMP